MARSEIEANLVDKCLYGVENAFKESLRQLKKGLRGHLTKYQEANSVIQQNYQDLKSAYISAKQAIEDEKQRSFKEIEEKRKEMQSF